MNAEPELRMEAHEWRARQQDGPLTGEEAARFKGWLAKDPRHVAAYAEAEIAWQALGEVDYESFGVKVPARDVVHREHVRVLKPTTRLRATSRPFLALAAGIAIVFAALTLLLTERGTSVETDPVVAAQYGTGRGEVRTWQMPDGTMITLGPVSRVDYRFSDDSRRVWLHEGAAFLEVAQRQSMPFVVDAGPAQVMVTGTTFDMQLRRDQLTVSVAEGAVRISEAATEYSEDSTQGGKGGSNRSADSVVLTVGEQATVQRGTGISEKSNVDHASLGAWRTGRLAYVDTELQDIVEDLNRYTLRPIEVDDDARTMRLSATFSVDREDETLEVLQMALPVTISETTSGRRIALRR